MVLIIPNKGLTSTFRTNRRWLWPPVWFPSYAVHRHKKREPLGDFRYGLHSSSSPS